MNSTYIGRDCKHLTAKRRGLWRDVLGGVALYVALSALAAFVVR